VRVDPLEKANHEYWARSIKSPLGILFDWALTLSPRRIVNVLSLSRIGFGLFFVLLFQRSAGLLYVSVGLCLVALLTDLLDGYLARRLQVDSIHGRLWDSLGDKSFYAGIIIAFQTQGFLGPLVCWCLIVREIALYITRVLFIEKLPKIEEIRPSTNWHGYFMYITIVLGLSRMYAEIHGLSFPFPIHLSMQISAYAAVACGVFSIIHFLRLR
jgi:phosphatidylglycerophosphate synthase